MVLVQPSDKLLETPEKLLDQTQLLTGKSYCPRHGAENIISALKAYPTWINVAIPPKEDGVFVVYEI